METFIPHTSSIKGFPEESYPPPIPLLTLPSLHSPLHLFSQVSKSLNGAETFILLTPQHPFLWCGNSSSEADRTALSLAAEVLKVRSRGHRHEWWGGSIIVLLVALQWLPRLSWHCISVVL